MYQFELLLVGKQKENPEKILFSRYQKQLKPYARLSVKELPEIKFSSVADRTRVLKKEATLFEKKITNTHCLIVLDANGTSFSSEHFAKQLSIWSEQEQKKLLFLIGGPLGIDDQTKKKADVLLSLSPFTLPHDLACVVLCEQLYRAMTIIFQKTYHY